MEGFESILKQHVDNNTIEMDEPGLCIAVRRRHLWKDSKLVLARSSNDYSMGMRVTFVLESAVDEGWPRREYFRFVLAELARNNALSDGNSDRRVLRHNLIELEGNSLLGALWHCHWFMVGQQQIFLQGQLPSIFLAYANIQFQ